MTQGLGVAPGHVLLPGVVKDHGAVFVAQIHDPMRNSQKRADPPRLLDITGLARPVARICDRSIDGSTRVDLHGDAKHIVPGVLMSNAATEESTPPLIPTTTRDITIAPGSAGGAPRARGQE